MALNHVVELIDITTPTGSIRINTAGRDLTYKGNIYKGKGIQIEQVRINPPRGNNPGGVSVVISGLSYRKGRLSADIEPVFSFYLPNNAKYAGYKDPAVYGGYIPRDSEDQLIV